MKLHHNFYYRPHAFVGYVSLGILFFLSAAFLTNKIEASELEFSQMQYNIAHTGASTQR